MASGGDPMGATTMGPARQIAEDVRRTRRGEGDDRVGARDLWIGLCRHRVGIGARRDVHRDHRLAAAIHGGDGIGIEALHRRPETGAEYRVNQQVAICQTARRLCLQLLRVAQHDRA